MEEGGEERFLGRGTGTHVVMKAESGIGTVWIEDRMGG